MSVRLWRTYAYTRDRDTLEGATMHHRAERDAISHGRSSRYVTDKPTTAGSIPPSNDGVSGEGKRDAFLRALSPNLLPPEAFSASCFAGETCGRWPATRVFPDDMTCVRDVEY